MADPAAGAPGDEVTSSSDSPGVTSSDGVHDAAAAADGSDDAAAPDGSEGDVPEVAEAPPAGEQPAKEQVVGPTGFPRLETETVEKFGRPMRLFPVAVSAEAMALAWANQEDAPSGATVVVDHEIRPSGLHGRMWNVPAVDTLACSVVLRPALKMEDADSSWLVGAWAAAEGAEKASGRELATWWPDAVVDATTREQVSAVRAEIQLGPGRVKSVVLTLRFDLPGLGLDASRKDDLLEAVMQAMDTAREELDGGTIGAVYEQRCALLGNRLMIRLLPKGETRGTARRIDRGARLELESPSGLVEKITVDQVRDMKIV